MRQLRVCVLVRTCIAVGKIAPTITSSHLLTPGTHQPKFLSTFGRASQMPFEVISWVGTSICQTLGLVNRRVVDNTRVKLTAPRAHLTVFDGTHLVTTQKRALVRCHCMTCYEMRWFHFLVQFFRAKLTTHHKVYMYMFVVLFGVFVCVFGGFCLDLYTYLV